MTKLWVKRKVEHSVLKTICPRRRSGRQSQCMEAHRELVPLRSNGFQIFSTNIPVTEGTQAGGGGGGKNIYLRTVTLSERLCSVQCWLAAELAPVVLGRLRSNVKSNVLKNFISNKLGFYWLFKKKHKKNFN